MDLPQNQNLTTQDFHNGIRREWKFGAVNVRLHSAHSEADTGPIEIERPFLCALLSGRVTVHGIGSTTDSGPGAITFYPHATVNNIEVIEENTHWLGIDIPEEFHRQVYSLNRPNRAVFKCDDPKLISKITRVVGLTSIATDADQWNIYDELDELFQQHLQTTFKVVRCSSVVNQLKNLARERFSTTLGLREAAEITGMNPSHLGRVFKKSCGCTFGEYLSHVRVENAVQSILQSNDSLTHIALECGFADHSHMCRVFQDCVGISPGQIRRVSN